MKQLLVFSVLALLIGFSLDAQVSDDQWYIKDAIKFRNGSPNTYRSLSQLPQPVTGTQSQYEYFIEGITYPFPLPSGEPASKTPRNDLFIIYEDGSYFNSYKLPLWPNRDGQNSNGVQQMESYKLETDRPIDYLYYTNVYDGDDDPNALVTTSPTSQFTGVTMDDLIQPSSPFLSINHTLVKGKDFTLILDLDGPRNPSKGDPEISTCAELSICWEAIAVEGIEAYIEPSFTFNNNADFTLGSPIPPSFNSGCAIFNGNSLNPSSNVFINLHVDSEIPFKYLNQDVEFKLFCGKTLMQSVKVELANAHDPNFTDLVCIREEGEFYYASYIVNCTNDVANPDATTSATFSFVPPAGAITIEEKIVKINDIIVVQPSYTTSWANTANDPFYRISTNGGEVLDQYTPGDFMKSSLYAELCIKYRKDATSVFNPNDFIITNGYTKFGNDLYPIHANLSLCEDYEVDYLNGLPVLLNERRWCELKEGEDLSYLLSSFYCDCKCGPSNSNCFERFFCWLRNLFT